MSFSKGSTVMCVELPGIFPAANHPLKGGKPFYHQSLGLPPPGQRFPEGAIDLGVGVQYMHPGRRGGRDCSKPGKGGLF